MSSKSSNSMKPLLFTMCILSTGLSTPSSGISSTWRRSWMPRCQVSCISAGRIAADFTESLPDQGGLVRSRLSEPQYSDL